MLSRRINPGCGKHLENSVKVSSGIEQDDKYIRVSSLRNRHLTSPQLAASLNSARKTPVSTSTVKRCLRDAGFLVRVAKKNHTVSQTGQ
jgi:hypothetical protein